MISMAIGASGGDFPKAVTKRSKNPGAEKWLGVKIPVLDHGFVYLVDYMGSDAAIEQAARVSYGVGTRSVTATRGLIRYLMRHRHTSPFEMAELKFHAKLPIFVARQWVRHRTASINEYSARYSILSSEFYIPEESVICWQSTRNKQGRGDSVGKRYAKRVRSLIKAGAKRDYELYEFFLNDDGDGKPADPRRPMMARELARSVLPVGVYTEWYWKIDLHNLLHFLSLRLDTHAQWEIRQYAEAMARIVKDSFPLTWEAFEDYVLESVTLSRPEGEVLSKWLSREGISINVDEVPEVARGVNLGNERERQELILKLRRLGLIR